MMGVRSRRRPLLVAQGANDPRVPLAESDQIIQAVAKNNVPVWYVGAKNEGHGGGEVGPSSLRGGPIETPRLSLEVAVHIHDQMDRRLRALVGEHGQVAQRVEGMTALLARVCPGE